MKTIFSKIFGAYLITILLLVTLILVFSFNRVKDHSVDIHIHELNHLNRAVSVQIKDYLIKGEMQAIDSLVKIIGFSSHSRITVVLPDGTVVADSEKEPSTMENHKDRPEIIEAASNREGSAIRYSYSINKDMLYNAIQVRNGSKLLGFSRVSIPLHYMDILYSDLIWRIIAITAVILIVSLIMFFIFSQKVSGNINKLVSASKTIADGDFSTKVYLNTSDELKILAENFNNMSNRLNELFNEVSFKQEELRSIIKSIKDGIVVIDAKDRITLSNENFKSYFNNGEIIGKYFWELIRDLNFKKLIKKVQHKGESKVTEVHFGENYYLASASWNDIKKETVVIFYDINELKKLEQVKKDFIVNVSHELRTPLTAIKGFVETLMDDASEEQKHYINIISRQTQRLINIVQDLLLLSKVENPETKINLSIIKPNNMVDNIFRVFQAASQEKGIELKALIGESTEIVADESMLEQIFINLIENALKYTDSGSITISITNDENTGTIEVEDTGMGIPTEHQGRIFERFYTVNKSRAKNMSGTGLGLAIVKHIVSLHNGSISFTSTVGKGTKFTIQLPRVIKS
jgi:two-component system phosphate regulon sensor histidine kinase PhoR